MREEAKRFHTAVLQAYEGSMFETLVHPHNIITESAKMWQFEDKDGFEINPLRGFFAMKDTEGQKRKYFIEEKFYSDLPLRINTHEEIFFKDTSRSRSVVLRPTNITPFRIKPEKCWDSDREFIESLAPFLHSNPDMWTLNKLCAVMSYLGKTFFGISSAPEFGKSSIYSILNAITKKSPVFQPRSIPGILSQITGDGVMVFDDIHACLSEVKEHIENFSFNVADNKPVYINGAIQSKNTKPKYDVAHQSIVFLFNLKDNYREPEKQFWNFIWKGRTAMETRFLCLRFEGKLLEEFDKNFDIIETAEQNKMFYIKIAKHLMYLKNLKKSNSYERRFIDSSTVEYKGRHKIIKEEMLWIFDLYCKDQQEFDKFNKLFDDCVISYQTMLRGNVPIQYSGDTFAGFEQKSSQKQDKHAREEIVSLLSKKGKMSVDDLESSIGKNRDIDTIIKEMLLKGDIMMLSNKEVMLVE